MKGIKELLTSEDFQLELLTDFLKAVTTKTRKVLLDNGVDFSKLEIKEEPNPCEKCGGMEQSWVFNGEEVFRHRHPRGRVIKFNDGREAMVYTWVVYFEKDEE